MWSSTTACRYALHLRRRARLRPPVPQTPPAPPIPPAPSLGEVDQFRSAMRSAVQAVAPPPGFAGRTYTVTVAVIFQMTVPNGQ